MNKSTTSPHCPTIRVNLLHAHGSPTCYQYQYGCRCAPCRKSKTEADAMYRLAHREEGAATHIAYQLTHREETAAYQTAYRITNREESVAYQAAYAKEHRDQKCANGRNREARKSAALGTHTAADVATQYLRQHGRCYWCDAKVGKTYHVDHVIPLARGGSNGPENLVVSCPTCNLAKGAKHPMDFAGVLC